MYRFHDLVFQWPLLLWLLLIVPALIFMYWRLLVRQRRVAQRFTALGSGTGVQRPRWFSRHGPAVLMLVGLTMLILAIARPQAVVVLPTRVDSIILAMDISGSMRATDVKPNRLVAAQNAAKTFVNAQPSDVRIGVVSIASTAALAQSPTAKREEVIETIDRFQLQKGTALGSGIVIALTTLLPDAAIDVDKAISGTTSYNLSPEQRTAIANFKPVPPGSNASAAIILLTDGESNTGPDMVTAAKLAAERGVRVYTVGIGTKQGATLSVDGWSIDRKSVV